MSIDIEKGIVLESFTKKYGRESREVTACRGVDFSATPGQVVGILGPNGAGKSTLLKTLCGMQYPTDGKICVCGTEDFNDIRKITGYVPEFPELDRNLTVLETLYLEAKLRGIREDEIMGCIDRALTLSELHDVATKRVGTLSKGYTQRTSFAKAVCFSPKVLVLDEFSGGLDPAQTARMRKTIKNLSSKMIIIQSTHRIEEAEQMCDYIYLMNGGTIVAKGTVQQIIEESGKKSLEEAFIFLTKD